MNPLNNVEAEAIIQDLIDIAPYAEIAHHIPGRIRLKMSISGLKVLYEKDIRYTLDHVPGVFSTRVNPSALSAVIEYDQEKLPYELWTGLVESGRKPELAAEVVERLRALFDRVTVS